MRIARQLEYPWISKEGVIEVMPWAAADPAIKPLTLRWVDKRKVLEDGSVGGEIQAGGERNHEGEKTFRSPGPFGVLFKHAPDRGAESSYEPLGIEPLFPIR